MNALFDTPYYRVTKMFCSLVGLWPYQPQHKRRIMQSLQMFVLYFSIVPPQMVRICQVWNKDLDAMCTCLTPIFVLILCTIKIVTIDRFELEMRTLLRQIETEWEITSGKEEYNILVKYTTKSRKLCVMYSTAICNALSCFVIIPTFSPILDIVLPQNETRVRNLAFDLDYGIDQQHYWFWLWLHLTTMGIITIFNLVAADILYVTLTIHGSCLFAIAGHKLEHMTDTMEKNAAQSLKTSNYDMDYDTYRHDEDIPLKLKKQAMVIRECVISHKKAIRYTHLLNRIYTLNFLATVGVSAISISITAIQLVSRLFRWAEMALSIAYIIAGLIHLYVLTLMAQNILDESMKIHESIFSSPWYNMPVKFWKDVAFILMRSHIPCKLTAGKMFVMSLESFCSILQTSVSYFTLLASFR